MPTNNFLPFAIGGGANVEAQGTYAADPLLSTGNQPGIAVSAFNNKALRQANVISSQLAQYVANTTGTDVLDDTLTTKLLSQIFSAFSRKAPVITTHLSSSGTHNLSYKFQVASANATVGATYSDGTTTFTVSATISAALELVATGAAAPVVSGTLTKASGTGDATITYNAVRSPVYMRVRAVGAGGGSGGASTSGGAGGNTTFGTSLLTANGGAGGAVGGTAPGAVGGTATIATSATVFQCAALQGGSSTATSSTAAEAGTAGGVSFFGGAGAGGQNGVTGTAGVTNSGSGGGGGGGAGGNVGGGAGGYLEAVLTPPLSTYAWTVGAAGTAGTGSPAGQAGGSGAIIVEEHYQ